MRKLQITTDPGVEKIFNNYPAGVYKKMMRLRKLVLETANEIAEIESITETLKWNEPSFIVKKGSTLRIDWKKKEPEQYAMYFKCTSKLVPTFQLVFGKIFTYEGNRAIIFEIKEKIPVPELKKCIKACLTYHQVKQLPMLGL